MVSATRYGEDVAQHGFSKTHRQIVEWVPRGARVLDIGCATGYVGRQLMQEKGCSVVGLEVDEAAAAKARQAGLTVHVGSVLDPKFRKQVKGPFDAIVAADVLEHLTEPEVALRAARGWLADGGRLIVATPNIAAWRVRWQLLVHGKFEYTDTGIFDRTHVHFFTHDSFRRLVAEHGWQVRDRLFELVDIPGANTVLFDIPTMMRERYASWEQAPTALERKVQWLLYDQVATFLHRSQRRLGVHLARRWPNLCAVHMAYLLEPAASAAHGAGSA
jgi:methionine biosynthesis protein MetW